MFLARENGRAKKDELLLASSVLYRSKSKSSFFRTTFFDQIDEFIQYLPGLPRKEKSHALGEAIGIANGKIFSYDWRADMKRIYEYSYSFKRSEWKNSSVETTDEVKKMILEYDFVNDLHFLRVEDLQRKRWAKLWCITF